MKNNIVILPEVSFDVRRFITAYEVRERAPRKGYTSIVIEGPDQRELYLSTSTSYSKVMEKILEKLEKDE